MSVKYNTEFIFISEIVITGLEKPFEQPLIQPN